MKRENFGEHLCYVMGENNQLVPNTAPHEAHEWEWLPDHGPQVIAVYQCSGQAEQVSSP